MKYLKLTRFFNIVKFVNVSTAFMVFMIILFTFTITNTFACTGIQLKAKDGSIISGRTLEFALPLKLNTIFVPRGYEFKTKLDKNKSGLNYTTKYAYIGATAFNDTSATDGLNEKGLSVGTFYFPGYAVYKNLNDVSDTTHLLSPTQFCNWIISQFASVDEVKKALTTVAIANVIPTGWEFVPPFHYIVYDKTGNSIVIEPLKSGLKVYDNPIGVITNSPTFDWHLTNLKNYINLSAISVESKNINNHILSAFGQGSGMLGLPGDFTPPSRFIRATVFSQLSVPAPSVNKTIEQAFHILNQFDIPAGTVKSIQHDKTFYDYTVLTAVRDPQNLIFYYKTYDNSTIKKISLHDFNWDSKDIVTAPIEGTEPYFTQQ